MVTFWCKHCNESMLLNLILVLPWNVETHHFQMASQMTALEEVYGSRPDNESEIGEEAKC
jgi:hypothetical protein